MFIEFITTRNEKLKLNINKILMILATKKGTTIVLEDGSQYDVLEKYDYICDLLSKD